MDEPSGLYDPTLKELKKDEPTPSYGYAETFARTSRMIDSDWACRPFVYSEVARFFQENHGQIGGIIADIGGGEGKVARDLRDMGIEDPIITFDINEGMVEKARKEEERNPRGIKILQGDALHIPLEDGSVKLGLRVLVDGHWTLSEVNQGNIELKRVLQEDGIAIVTIPDPEAYIDQTINGRHTPGVVVNNEMLVYKDNEEVDLTLKNTEGRSVNIPAKMHRVESYRKSFEDAGLEIIRETVPDLDDKELHDYQEKWGQEAKPFHYRIFVLKKKT